MRYRKRLYVLPFALLIGYFIINAVRIYHYSFEYHERQSDVAIVLGAGTSDGKLSPVFRERINHSLLLYQQGAVSKIIFTGGFGKNQMQSDSQIAKEYAVNKGIPANDLLIEEKSNYTLENLKYANEIMDDHGFGTALLVSDPLHMKRAMKLAGSHQIDCLSSPTQTSMYRSMRTRFGQLLYETFYFTLREPISIF